MMMTKRSQGRPPRDSGINGRERLIEATRVYLQSNRKMSLTRSEIAQGCGVTPALISYYFKDKRSLFDAVTKPLIRSYREKLSSILDGHAPPPDRMRSVIRLLIEMNTENAFLVDHMLREAASDQLEAEDRVVFDIYHNAISGLVQELMTGGHWRASDPLLTELALWGMCRAFGEALRLPFPASAAFVTHADPVGTKVEYVFAVFAARPASCHAAKADAVSA